MKIKENQNRTELNLLRLIIRSRLSPQIMIYATKTNI